MTQGQTGGREGPNGLAEGRIGRGRARNESAWAGLDKAMSPHFDRGPNNYENLFWRGQLGSMDGARAESIWDDSCANKKRGGRPTDGGPETSRDGKRTQGTGEKRQGASFCGIGVLKGTSATFGYYGKKETGKKRSSGGSRPQSITWGFRVCGGRRGRARLGHWDDRGERNADAYALQCCGLGHGEDFLAEETMDPL